MDSVNVWNKQEQVKHTCAQPEKTCKHPDHAGNVQVFIVYVTYITHKQYYIGQNISELLSVHRYLLCFLGGRAPQAW